MVLLTSFFVALGNEADAVARNLHWYGFGSAVVALFVAGLLAGWLSGVRGGGSGLFHGLTTWGLILVVTLAFPFPQAFGLLEIFATPLPELGADPLWAAFLSLLIGLIAAAAGGMIGGASGRPGILAATMDDTDHDYRAAHAEPGTTRTEPATAPAAPTAPEGRTVPDGRAAPDAPPARRGRTR